MVGWKGGGRKEGGRGKEEGRREGGKEGKKKEGLATPILSINQAYGSAMFLK